MNADRTVRTGQILAPVSDLAAAASNLPSGHASLAEVTALLNAAAAYQRAVNPAPVVLHQAAAPVTAPPISPTAHPGIDIRIPAPPAATERNPWPLVFMVSACTGIGSCLVTSVTGSLVSMAVTLAAFAVWGTATYQLVFVREP